MLDVPQIMKSSLPWFWKVQQLTAPDGAQEGSTFKSMRGIDVSLLTEDTGVSQPSLSPSQHSCIFTTLMSQFSSGVTDEALSCISALGLGPSQNGSPENEIAEAGVYLYVP